MAPAVPENSALGDSNAALKADIFALLHLTLCRLPQSTSGSEAESSAESE